MKAIVFAIAWLWLWSLTVGLSLGLQMRSQSAPDARMAEDSRLPYMVPNVPFSRPKEPQTEVFHMGRGELKERCANWNEETWACIWDGGRI